MEKNKKTLKNWKNLNENIKIKEEINDILNKLKDFYFFKYVNYFLSKNYYDFYHLFLFEKFLKLKNDNKDLYAINFYKEKDEELKSDFNFMNEIFESKKIKKFTLSLIWNLNLQYVEKCNNFSHYEEEKEKFEKNIDFFVTKINEIEEKLNEHLKNLKIKNDENYECELKLLLEFKKIFYHIKSWKNYRYEIKFYEQLFLNYFKYKHLILEKIY